MEYISIIILVITFVTLMGLGVPVAWSLGFSSFVTLIVTVATIPSATTIAQRMGAGLDSFSLLAIPFFILAGEIMNKGGVATRLINLAKALTGRLPGGLLYVNVISAMLFGAIAGSAVAAASAIGGILGKRMEDEGYPKELGAAVNITSSTTGLIIPPSNVLIVYSLASGGVSIAALFVAGYVPGLLIGLLLMLMGAYFIQKKKLPSSHSIRGIGERFYQSPSEFGAFVYCDWWYCGWRVYGYRSFCHCSDLYADLILYLSGAYPKGPSEDFAYFILYHCGGGPFDCYFHEHVLGDVQ